MRILTRRPHTAARLEAALTGVVKWITEFTDPVTTMLKILQISDPHLMAEETGVLLGVNTGYYFRRVLEHAHRHHGPFDLLLLSGDLAQEPCPASYGRILAELQAYPSPCLCLPGNHDDPELMQRILHGGRVSCARFLQLQNWQIVCLNSRLADSPAGEISAAELLFLEQRLAAADAPCLLTLHHHCISSGSPWMDTMQIRNSDELLAVVDRHPQVKLIAFGHVHQEINARRGETGIFSAPSTCFQFQPFAPEMAVSDESPGYRLFELAADGSFSTECHRIPDVLTGLNRNSHGY